MAGIETVKELETEIGTGRREMILIVQDEVSFYVQHSG